MAPHSSQGLLRVSSSVLRTSAIEADEGGLSEHFEQTSSMWVDPFEDVDVVKLLENRRSMMLNEHVGPIGRPQQKSLPCGTCKVSSHCETETEPLAQRCVPSTLPLIFSGWACIACGAPHHGCGASNKPRSLKDVYECVCVCHRDRHASVNACSRSVTRSNGESNIGGPPSVGGGSQCPSGPWFKRHTGANGQLRSVPFWGVTKYRGAKHQCPI